MQQATQTLTLTELSGALRTGAVTARTLAEEALSRIRETGEWKKLRKES